MFDQLFNAENSKAVVFTLLAVLLVPLLSWILFFRTAKRTPFLNPDVWQELPLVEKEVITHNTRRFRYDLKPLCGTWLAHFFVAD